MNTELIFTLALWILSGKMYLVEVKWVGHFTVSTNAKRF